MSESDQPGTVLIENAKIQWRNFGGRETQFKPAGVRTFAVFLPEDLAEQMAADGWNVKLTKSREEGDPQEPYVEVTVFYGKGQPPRCVMITSRGRTDLSEDTVEVLDWVTITNVDLIIRPHVWSVNGRGGVKAYLKSIYVTIDEDPLEQKYAELNQVPHHRATEDQDGM